MKRWTVRVLATFGAATLAWGLLVWSKVEMERRAAR